VTNGLDGFFGSLLSRVAGPFVEPAIHQMCCDADVPLGLVAPLIRDAERVSRWRYWRPGLRLTHSMPSGVSS
jgi:hypothetical protein